MRDVRGSIAKGHGRVASRDLPFRDTAEIAQLDYFSYARSSVAMELLQ
jgi:hypothetical protein